MLTFEKSGVPRLYEDGTDYFVRMGREIAGTAYRCEATSSMPEQHADALKACKSLEQEAAKQVSEVSAEPADEAEQAGVASLTLLGLIAEMPDEWAVASYSVTIDSPDLETLTIAMPSGPRTVDEAREKAAKDEPENAETEALADGWAFTYEKTSARRDGTTWKMYFVNVRREIAGRMYSCAAFTATAQRHADALSTCKSLAP